MDTFEHIIKNRCHVFTFNKFPLFVLFNRHQITKVFMYNVIIKQCLRACKILIELINCHERYSYIQTEVKISDICFAVIIIPGDMNKCSHDFFFEFSSVNHFVFFKLNCIKSSN